MRPIVPFSSRREFFGIVSGAFAAALVPLKTWRPAAYPLGNKLPITFANIPIRFDTSCPPHAVYFLPQEGRCVSAMRATYVESRLLAQSIEYP